MGTVWTLRKPHPGPPRQRLHAGETTLARRRWRPHGLWRLRTHGAVRRVRTSPPERRMHSLLLPFARRGASHLAGPGSSGPHTPPRHWATREAARAGGPGQGRALGRAPRCAHRGRAARSPRSRQPHGGRATRDAEMVLGGVGRLWALWAARSSGFPGGASGQEPTSQCR